MTRRSTGRGGVRQDRNTLRMIWAVILVSIAAGVYVAAHWRAAALPHPRLFALIGLLIFLPGLGVALVGDHPAWPFLHGGCDDREGPRSGGERAVSVGASSVAHRCSC